MQSKYSLYIMVLFVCHGLYSFSQGAGNDGTLKGNATVSGKVIHHTTNAPVEYANIILFSMPGNTMITGTVTGSNGKFTLENIPVGNYFLTADFIGFQKSMTDTVRITASRQKTDLGLIRLKPASIELDGVDVVADRDPVEYKIDKKVVNVSQDILAAGGTAADVLDNTPSVQVDIEGNVTLRGSSGFTVLVNGRPTILENNEALQQIPASSIENIEIITNPSAKYDPEGTAGIINIILKKKKHPGFTGLFNLTAGTGDKYDGDFLLSYKTENVNLHGGLDFREQNYEGKRLTEREVFHADTTFYLFQDGTRYRYRGGMGGRAGIDWHASGNTIIGLSGRFGVYTSAWDGKTENKEFRIPGTEKPEYYISEDDSPRRTGYVGMVLTFDHKMDTLGQKINSYIFYANRNGDDDASTTEWMTSEEYIITDGPFSKIKTDEKERYRELRFKLEYTKPFFNNSRFEAGVELSALTDFEEYSYLEYRGAAGWINNEDFSSEMDFNRSVIGSYATYSHHLFGIRYQAGLRMEYTKRSIRDERTGNVYKIDRPDFFPTLHLSKKLKNNHQLYGSYTKRINRPREKSMEPFRYYVDANNIWEGNPELEPEYIHSMEAGWLKKWPGSFLSLEGYYRITNNLVNRIILSAEDDVVIHTYRNFNQDHALGSEAMLNTDPASWLSFNLTGNVYHYRLNGELEGEEINKKNTNWNLRLNTTLKFRSNTRIEIRTAYRGPSITYQGTTEGYYYADAAIRQNFLERALSATIQVRDIFGTMKREFTSTGQHFYEHSTFTRESRIVMLTVSYRLNQIRRKSDKSLMDDNTENLDTGY
ncbi:MAG: outer membrane beta-barrel family protein [Bacteroidales bacterium]